MPHDKQPNIRWAPFPQELLKPKSEKPIGRQWFGNWFSNSISLLALAVSALGTWYSVDTQREIALQEQRPRLFFQANSGVDYSADFSRVSYYFKLENNGPGSAKDVTVKYTVKPGATSINGVYPGGEDPNIEEIRAEEIDRELGFNLPLDSYSREKIPLIIQGNGSLFVNIVVNYASDSGEKFVIRQCVQFSVVDRKPQLIYCNRAPEIIT